MSNDPLTVEEWVLVPEVMLCRNLMLGKSTAIFFTCWILVNSSSMLMEQSSLLSEEYESTSYF
jgi:hypothetical protein